MKFAISILLFILVISCQAGDFPQSQTTSKPDTIEQLLDDYFRTIIALNPEIGSYLGLASDGDYPFDQSQLTDSSEEAYQRELEIVKRYRKWLDTYKNLTPQQEIEAEVFRCYLDNIITKDPFHRNDYTINSMFGMHIDLQTRMTEYHKITSKQDALDYISRLDQFQMRFDNFFSDLEFQKKNGIIPPQAIIERTHNVMNDMITEDPRDNIFYTDFAEKLNLLNIPTEEKSELLQQAELAVENIVLLNYRKFDAELLEIMKDADDIPGLWKISDGDALYRYYLKNHTTTDLTPEEIHQLGLQETERIQQEMLQRFAELGFTEGATFGEIEGEYWHSLKGDKHTFSQGESGKQQALEHYLQILEETRKKLPDYFSRLPQTQVNVRRVPLHKEKFTGQYYHRAPLDGSEPAAFCTNLSWIPKKPGMSTLLFHETIPGHHLQIAYASEYCNAPIYRTLTFFTAYIEGWALYAEKLAFENGWHKDIYSELGYLNSELHRAVRLVVDTGIHYKKWSRTKAYNYMEDNMGWGSYGEIDRYTVWAGQACAYKIGELKILELREKAKRKLGDKFDLKEFHEIVLQNGAIPLDLLEKVVDEWLH